jgi:glucosamine--fructose-6-phosphate aminotransferase (isomerizing)
MSSSQPGSVMASEMAEQPRVLRELLARRETLEEALCGTGQPAPKGVILVARGTSDHAAVFGRYLLEAALGVPVGLLAPSLWTRYGRSANLDGQLLIALSQSGRTPEIERVVQLARAAGATTLAITNEPDSPLARSAQDVLALEAGIERAVPATKTFTAEVLALALLADALAPGRFPGLEDLESMPALQEQLIRDGRRARGAAAHLMAARALVAVGSGFLYAVALEAALKLLETTSLPVLAYSASDFLHGPLAVAAPDVPVVCFATAGPVREDVERVAAAAAARGAPIVWISEEPRPGGSAEEHLPVPPPGGEPLAGLLHIVRAQQLALEISRALGRDPDSPDGLEKVTITT